MLVTWLRPPVALGPQPGPQSPSVCPGWDAGAVTEGWQLGTRGEVGVRSSRLGRLLGSTLCTQQDRLTFPHKQLLAALRLLSAHTARLSHASPGFLGGLRHRRGK